MKSKNRQKLNKAILAVLLRQRLNCGYASKWKVKIQNLKGFLCKSVEGKFFFRTYKKDGSFNDIERGMSFEQITMHIERGDVLDIVAHPNQKKYPNQQPCPGGHNKK